MEPPLQDGEAAAEALREAKTTNFKGAMIGTQPKGVGAHPFMMGSDMPFPIGDFTPRKIIMEAGVSAADVASITGGLAQTLFLG